MGFSLPFLPHYIKTIFNYILFLNKKKNKNNFAFRVGPRLILGRLIYCRCPFLLYTLLETGLPSHGFVVF